jgi:hypothetical protein
MTKDKEIKSDTLSEYKHGGYTCPKCGEVHFDCDYSYFLKGICLKQPIKL